MLLRVGRTPASKRNRAVIADVDDIVARCLGEVKSCPCPKDDLNCLGGIGRQGIRTIGKGKPLRGVGLMCGVLGREIPTSAGKRKIIRTDEVLPHGRLGAVRADARVLPRVPQGDEPVLDIRTRRGSSASPAGAEREAELAVFAAGRVRKFDGELRGAGRDVRQPCAARPFGGVRALVNVVEEDIKRTGGSVRGEGQVGAGDEVAGLGQRGGKTVAGLKPAHGSRRAQECNRSAKIRPNHCLHDVFISLS